MHNIQAEDECLLIRDEKGTFVLSTEKLRIWAIQYGIVDTATYWVQSRYEKEIDAQLAIRAEKEKFIKKDFVIINVTRISLWVSYKKNNQDSYIVVSVKIGYKEENDDTISNRDKVTKHIGMCKLFFSLQGIIDHDEFEIY